MGKQFDIDCNRYTWGKKHEYCRKTFNVKQDCSCFMGRKCGAEHRPPYCENCTPVEEAKCPSCEHKFIHTHIEDNKLTQALCPMHGVPEVKGDWEERFDKEFTFWNEEFVSPMWTLRKNITEDELKQFISKELARQRKDLIEEIRLKVRDMGDTSDYPEWHGAAGINVGLIPKEKVFKLLDDLGGKNET